MACTRLGQHCESFLTLEIDELDLGQLQIVYRDSHVGSPLLDPPTVEAEFNNIAGVVTNGIFARRPADVLLLGEASGVRTISSSRAR